MAAGGGALRARLGVGGAATPRTGARQPRSWCQDESLRRDVGDGIGCQGARSVTHLHGAPTQGHALCCHRSDSAILGEGQKDVVSGRTWQGPCMNICGSSPSSHSRFLSGAGGTPQKEHQSRGARPPLHRRPSPWDGQVLPTISLQSDPPVLRPPAFPDPSQDIMQTRGGRRRSGF